MPSRQKREKRKSVEAPVVSKWPTRKERVSNRFAVNLDRSLSMHPLASLEHDTVSGGPGSQSGNPVKDPVT
jgi:hypothetical protein